MCEKNFNSEWILSSGNGGYALGRGDLLNIRKYHGLLIASDTNIRRVHLVSSVEEKFEFGGNSMFIDSNSYYPDTIYPRGYSHLLKFWMRPYPSFLFSLGLPENEVIILKEIFMASCRNITLLSYTNMGKVSLSYYFRYKFTLRDHHWVNNPGTFDSSTVNAEVLVSRGIQAGIISRKDTGISARVFSMCGKLMKDPVIFRNIFYMEEAFRGYQALEDLYAPFLHSGVLNPGCRVDLLFSDLNPEDLFPHGEKDFYIIINEIKGRYRIFPTASDHPYQRTNRKPDKKYIFSFSSYRKLLNLIRSDFEVKFDLVAGFPWFSCWGRDTMISLESYLTGDKNIPFVYQVLNNYGSRIRKGIIPNVIGEGGEGSNYDTIDASLWFVIRSYQAFDALKEDEKLKIFSYCENILLNYITGTDLPFNLNKKDYLLEIHTNTEKALTWMDAKVGGKPVTPRWGKPVEINGMWFNALCMIEEMAGKLNKKEMKLNDFKITLEEIKFFAGKVKSSMEKFFVDGIWCDRIEGNLPVKEIRPNFVIALSLPFNFSDREGRRLGLECARGELLTPYGLRSLSTQSPFFKGKYEGNQESRDFAYHQGTVWTWLLLPYANLICKEIVEKDKLVLMLKEIISIFRDGLRSGVFSSVAEIWDGKDPHLPRGAPAQAWSVSALYCIEKMIQKLEY